jgi:superfamily II DNA helicase RecQ
MQYRFFWINAAYPSAGEEQLNQFLRSHAILHIEREFVAAAADSGWSVCVSYRASGANTAGKSVKVDYREVLNEEDFSVFAKCRNLRKQLAEQEGVPVYTVFSNQQLAEMVQQRVATISALRQIDGVGEAKAARYGEAFLSLLRESVESQ